MTQSVDFGRATLVIRRGRVSGRVSRRSLVVAVTLFLSTIVLAVVSLMTGRIQVDLSQVINYVLGSNYTQDTMVLLDWRLPRVLFAIVCGAALAVSGAIFQSFTRNPLGSPDIIGFGTGAYTGAVVMLLVFGVTAFEQIAAATLVGGILTAAVVFALSYSRGTLRPFRLILVGIGVSAMLSSLNALLLMRVSVEQALTAAVWGAGSLGSVGYDRFVPFLAVTVVLMVGAGLVSRPLRQLELGDDSAQALGSRVLRVRIGAIVVGVALTATVTAAVGPIGFIALVAPQISRRLTGGELLELVPVSLTGAFLLVSADLVSLHVDLPVGLVTVVVGGIYLVWMLLLQYRGRSQRTW